MTKVNENDLKICPSCFALVFEEFAYKHKAWHENFLALANPNAEYNDGLENRDGE